MYEMFLGPIEQSKPWSTRGISGVHSFLKKFWNLFFFNGNFNVSQDYPSEESIKILNQTIKKVTNDIEKFSLNTCVSSFMICINKLSEDFNSPKFEPHVTLVSGLYDSPNILLEKMVT